MTRIGTCSICGGPVVVPEMMLNPVPHCNRCGAIAKVPHGPVVEMERPIKPPLPTSVIFRGDGLMPLTWGQITAVFWPAARRQMAETARQWTESPLLRELERVGGTVPGDNDVYVTTAPVLVNLQTDNPRRLGVISASDGEQPANALNELVNSTPAGTTVGSRLRSAAQRLREGSATPTEQTRQLMERRMRELDEELQREIFATLRMLRAIDSGARESFVGAQIQPSLHYASAGSSPSPTATTTRRAGGPRLNHEQEQAYQALTWLCSGSSRARGCGRSTVMALYLIHQALDGHTVQLKDLSIELFVNGSDDTMRRRLFWSTVLKPMIQRYYPDAGLELCLSHQTLRCPRVEAALASSAPTWSSGNLAGPPDPRVVYDDRAPLDLERSTESWWRNDRNTPVSPMIPMPRDGAMDMAVRSARVARGYPDNLGGNVIGTREYERAVDAELRRQELERSVVRAGMDPTQVIVPREGTDESEG